MTRYFTWKEILILILLLLNIADCYYTNIALINGGKELNPIVNFILNSFGGITTVMFIKVSVLIGIFFLVEKYNNFFIDVLLIFTTFVYFMLYGYHLYNVYFNV